MMAHLHELLSQDQEPFQLHNYIADKRFQLNKPLSNKSSSPFPKKLIKPLTKTSSSRPSLCFSSFQDSPDVRNSPFPSPTKKFSTKTTTGTLVFHVPPKTAALLLEAAIKIQNQKPKTKNVGFGLFGSILKKLKDKNRTKTTEFGTNGAGVMDINRKSDENHFVEERIGNLETDFSFSGGNNNSRISSSGWSENMETSCSTSRSDFYNEEIDCASQTQFCLSPLSPFRFALQTSPSPGCRTPEFLSPAATPSRCSTEVNEHEVTDDLQKVEHEEEDEKDQCSPVSVLDPPFEDDEQDGRDGEEGEDEDDYDYECSYAFMQKAQLRLLEKLRRFERLAELEPIELEKRMLEGHQEEDDFQDEYEECNDVDELGSSFTRIDIDGFVGEMFDKSNPCHPKKVPGDMKRLILDLINEEEKNGTDISNEVMTSIVCKRLDSWKEVESNTIDMMVELDLRREVDGWKRYDVEVKNRAKEIELAIFELLVEEISEELASSFIAVV